MIELDVVSAALGDDGRVLFQTPFNERMSLIPTEEYIGREVWHPAVCDSANVQDCIDLWESVYNGRRSHRKIIVVPKSDMVACELFAVLDLHWVGRNGVAAAGQWRNLSAPISGLTAKERKVLELMGTGGGVKAVSKSLGISVHTTHTHLKNIRNKAELESIDEIHSLATLYRSAIS